MPPKQKTRVLASHCASLTVPELEQSKVAVLSSLASGSLTRNLPAQRLPIVPIVRSEQL
jgi:hypothetical protein